MSLLPVEPQLLDHLVVEFGDHGRRAVDFLLTAEGLLNLDPAEGRPRLAETVAYCLREAMKTIPASAEVGGGVLWRSASRAVADARTRYELVRGVPGEDEQGALEEMLAKIDDLELVHLQEGIHERRLIAIIVNRTGALPLAAGTAPIRAYQGLLRDLDEALHAETTAERARQLWNQCAAILRQLFLPPDLRHAELESLASVDSPADEELERLLSLIAGPNHLRHFLSQISSAGWLECLTDTGILDPPAENGPWPVFAAVDRLASGHAPALADWLHRMYDRHSSDATRAWFIASAAVDVGTTAAPVVLRALGDHGAVAAMAPLGVAAVETLDPASEVVETFADLLLNEGSWLSTLYVDPVIERLLSGVDEANVARRLQLLCWKLRSIGNDEPSRRWFSYERAGSIADSHSDGSGDRFTALLEALVDAVQRATAWLSTEHILSIIDSLPEDIRARFRAFVLSLAPTTDIRDLIEEVATAVSQRDPTGDDLPLLDRVVDETEPEQYAALWMQALGSPPTVVEVAQRLSAHTLPSDWLRAFHWASLLPEEAVGAWAGPASVVAGAYGRPGRETLRTRRHGEVLHGRSPITAEELESLSVTEASSRISGWRPDPTEWGVSARQLARTLEVVVKANTEAWLTAPLRVVTDLRHPTYVHHYLQAIAEAIKSGAHPPAGELVDVVGLVQAHPWAAEPLGRDDFEYDKDWRNAEQAAVDVLKALADKDVGFAARDDEVWAVLETEARNRAEPSAIISGARDPLDSAINRRCTRALDAVLSFMVYDFRSANQVRPEALALLEDSLRLHGSDGAEGRAIVVTRLGFLRHIRPDWVDEVDGLLFGTDAPNGLAQVTADLAIKWSRPSPWLLERHQNLVRNAVTRDVKHALEHLLTAMLWEIPGYSVEDNISLLRRSPTRLSKAGEMLGRLLRHADAEEGHIASAVAFWDAAISTGEPGGLAGFGWLAEVERLDDDTWARRTMETVRMTNGSVDWSHKVAERAASLSPSTIALAIINGLVRGASEEWDRRRNIERAVELLEASVQLASTPEYERLRTTLLERGAI